MKNFGWLILLGLLYFGWQAGWFDQILNYFSESSKQSRAEQVIEEEDGNTRTFAKADVALVRLTFDF